MAKNTSLVYLGYEDEQIADKQTFCVDFTTNKIGGKPNWPNSDISIPPCPLCGLIRPLILQIYAPLDNSQFHRTFYAFACMNSICSNQSKGWICIRAQHLENVFERNNAPNNKNNKKKSNASQTTAKTNWCGGADDWGDESFDDDGCFDKNICSNQMQLVAQQPSFDDNLNEQNGNTLSNEFHCVMKHETRNMSEDEDESNSMDDPIAMFGNLQVIDDKNANCGEQVGAVGLLNSPSASAEIEGEESEMVCVDAPPTPGRDLIAMLKQTNAIPRDINNLILKGYYITVEEERQHDSNNVLGNDHIRDLLQKYQSEEEKQKTSPNSPCNLVTGGIVAMKGDSDEKYEKSIPVHGDLMFHNYLERIQQNPGQILRYSRDSLPLLIAPMTESIPKCQYCGSETLCEIQILSTLISKLQFINGDPAPIEYGNVLIFTCLNSCWDTPDKMRLEHVVVQKEI